MIVAPVSRRNISIQSGFTLMELLVAISLFSLIVVLLSSSFYFADKSRRHSLSSVDETEGIRQARRVLMQYLETAQPVWQRQGGDTALVFSGTDNELRFVSNMPAHLGDAGLYEIRLSIMGERGAMRLKFDRRLLHPDQYELHETTQVDGILLLSERNHIQFSYYGVIDENSSPGWITDWQVSNDLPKLVRLSIEDQSGNLQVLKIRMSARPSALSPVIKHYQALTLASDQRQ